MTYRERSKSEVTPSIMSKRSFMQFVMARNRNISELLTFKLSCMCIRHYLFNSSLSTYNHKLINHSSNLRSIILDICISLSAKNWMAINIFPDRNVCCTAPHFGGLDEDASQFYAKLCIACRFQTTSCTLLRSFKSAASQR